MESRRKVVKDLLVFLLKFDQLKEELAEGTARSLLGSIYYRLPSPGELGGSRLDLDEVLKRGVSSIRRLIGVVDYGCGLDRLPSADNIVSLRSCDEVRSYYPWKVLIVDCIGRVDRLLECLRGLGYEEGDLLVLSCRRPCPWELITKYTEGIETWCSSSESPQA